MKYYDVPTESRKVKISGAGRTITVCTDDCERFEMSAEAASGDLWDAVLLFKAFMSKMTIDQSFRDSNVTLARERLSHLADDQCDRAQSLDRVASCVLTRMAKTSGLKMTRVVYDEGNECRSVWSFDQPQKLISKRCTKVPRPANR
jgi:hypothetical protein